MKLLMIINFLTFKEEGGNSRFTYILNKLHDEDKNIDIELITSNFHHIKKAHREVTQYKFPYKVTLINEPGYKKNISLKRIYSHKVLSKNILKYLKNLTYIPDVIYCSIPSLDVASVASKYAKKNNIRFILDIQDLWPEAFKMALNVPIINNVLFFPMKLQANSIYKKADNIIAVSETYINRALKINKRACKCASIFLGTDLTIFDNIAKNIKNKKSDNILIGYIGTLGNSYNIIDVIRAVKILQDKNIKNIKLEIIGNGPLKEKFENEAKELKINCTFIDRLQYDKMIERLLKFDIALNPIFSKSAASIINKVGDYAAAGLPVINTQQSAEYINLVNNYNIGLNCPNDSVAIANALETLIKDEKLRKQMGKNNRKLAEEKFDRNKTYNEIIKIIKG